MDADIERLRRTLAPARPDPPIPPGVPAGVLVPLVDLPDPFLVFTKRSDGVRDHKGEISFPGGVRHAEDVDLVATALRETQEELGIPADAIEVLGSLPPTHTMVTGYVIVPFVGVLAEPPTYLPSPHEIDEVLEFQVHRLVSAEREVTTGEVEEPHRMYAYEMDGYVVWGATGRVLHSFLEALKEG
ncbi:MAG: NUDIX hydrolase [Actinomycetota bacterium]